METEENKLVVATDNNFGVAVAFSQEDMEAEVKDFRRIDLFASGSDKVKDELIGAGHFGISSQDSVESLGKEFNCIPIAVRPKAMRFGDEIITSFNPQTDLYQEIKSAARLPGMQPESEGMEFLLYIPSVGFLPYWLKNPSSMQAYPGIKSKIMKAITIESKLVKIEKGGQKFSFHAPKIKACQVEFEVPTPEEIQAAGKAFMQETIDVEKANELAKSEVVEETRER